MGLWIFLFHGRLPYHIDATLYAYPDHAINLESFHQGFIPLWNPYVAFGLPHLADWQSACFYPPFFLLNLTGLSNGFMAMALAHGILAFFGALLWLKSQRVGDPWSALGALSFAGSAHLVNCETNLPFIATAAWIPWIFWGAQRALDKKRIRDWTLLGGFLTLQILAGYVYFTFYTVLFLIVWFFFQKPGWKMALGFGFCLLAAGLLTSLQWLPFLDFLSYSYQAPWPSFPYFTQPREYLNLIRPDFLGWAGSIDYGGQYVNANFNPYFGLIPLTAFGMGLLMVGQNIFKKRKKNESFLPFWAYASLFWLLWLAGRHGWIGDLIPLRVLEFIEPSKAVGLFIFSVVTFSSRILHSFFGQYSRRKWTLPLVGLLAFLWMADLFSVPVHFLHPLPDPFHNPTVQSEVHEIKSFLSGNRILTFYAPNRWNFSGPDAFNQACQTRVQWLLPNSNAVWDIRSANSYINVMVQGSQNLENYLLKVGLSGDLLDLAGVRLFLLSNPVYAPQYHLLKKEGEDYLFFNTQASEELRWVGQTAVLTDRPAVLNTLTRPGSGWRKKVYLEKSASGPFTELPPSSRILEKPAPSGFQRPSGGDLSWISDFPGPGFVVFNETYAPGWRAWVDGKPEPLLRAYGLFMAVGIAAGGNHQLDFRYEPAAFRLGLFLSLFALILFSGFLAFIRRLFQSPVKTRR